MSTKSFFFWTRYHIDKLCNIFRYCFDKNHNLDFNDIPEKSRSQFVKYYVVVDKEKRNRGEDEKDCRLIFGYFQYPQRKTELAMGDELVCYFGISKIKLKNMDEPLIFTQLKLAVLLDFYIPEESLFNENRYIITERDTFGTFSLGGKMSVEGKLNTMMTLYRSLKTNAINDGDVK